jgi:hypothetical protein
MGRGPSNADASLTVAPRRGSRAGSVAPDPLRSTPRQMVSWAFAHYDGPSEQQTCQQALLEFAQSAESADSASGWLDPPAVTERERARQRPFDRPLTVLVGAGQLERARQLTCAALTALGSEYAADAHGLDDRELRASVCADDDAVPTALGRIIRSLAARRLIAAAV